MIGIKDLGYIFIVFTSSSTTKKGYDRLCSNKGKTPDATLSAQLYMDTKKPDSIFERIGQRPARFFLKGKPSIVKEEIKTSQNRNLEEKPNRKRDFKERVFGII